MFNTPWYLVVEKQSDSSLRVTHESNLEPLAQAWAAEHGGMVIATRKHIDDYEPLHAVPTSIEGPVHRHEGAVPKMSAEQPIAMPPGAVIQHEAGDKKPVLFRYEDVWIDFDSGINVLDLTPEVFADILEALRNAPELD